jgi:hypothetical protein
MSIVKVSYYAVKRVTLVFMIEENLMSLFYYGFKTRRRLNLNFK